MRAVPAAQQIPASPQGGPPRAAAGRRRRRPGGQRAARVPHHPPQRYLDTRFDGGGPFPPQGTTGEIFIFDPGDPDYFTGGLERGAARRPGDRLQPHRHRRYLRRQPARLPGQQRRDPLVSNVNWTARRSPTTPSWARPPPPPARSRPPSPCTTPRPRGVHVIVDISGYSSSKRPAGRRCPAGGRVSGSAAPGLLVRRPSGLRNVLPTTASSASCGTARAWARAAGARRRRRVPSASWATSSSSPSRWARSTRSPRS